MSSTTCHLTAKDSAYLQTLLKSKDRDEDFLDLVRNKLDSATLLLDHTIDPRVATIDSRVEFTVGGGFIEERVLTRDEKGSTLARALPVTTPRGLALLGLMEGDVFSLRKPNGIIEPIRLLKVIVQPQAAGRGPQASEIVDFKAHWMKSVAGMAHPPRGNDDPGPGPGAA